MLLAVLLVLMIPGLVTFLVPQADEQRRQAETAQD